MRHDEWESLARHGAPAGLTAAIQSLYSNPPFKVSHGGHESGWGEINAPRVGIPLPLEHRGWTYQMYAELGQPWAGLSQQVVRVYSNFAEIGVSSNKFGPI